MVTIAGCSESAIAIATTKPSDNHRMASASSYHGYQFVTGFIAGMDVIIGTCRG
jgi:hypothetical protein